MSALAFGFLCFSSLFTVIDPIAAAPLFASLTQHHDAASQRRSAFRAALVALVVLGVFALFGTVILSLFGITIEAFKIAGGLLFLIIAIGMLRGQEDPLSDPSSRGMALPAPVSLGEMHRSIQPNGAAAIVNTAVVERHTMDPSVVPIGVPLIAGPGAITTVTVLTAQSDGWASAVAFGGALVGALAATALVLAAAPKLFRRLGPSGVGLLTRLMGLIVLSIGVQFVVTGARDLLAL